MQVKRFVAANMRLALKMVREEIGPDAVILSNKRVPEGVELLTAIDIDSSSDTTAAAAVNPFQQAMKESQLAAAQAADKPASKLELELESMQRQAKARARMLAETLSAKSRSELEQAINASAIDAAVLDESALSADVVELKTAAAHTAATDNLAAVAQRTTAQDEDITQMRIELQSMRDLLERQFSTMAWGQFSQQNPQQASLWKRLNRMGVSAVLADSLLSEQSLKLQQGDNAPVEVWQSIMTSLSHRLPVVADDLIAAGGVFAFVGPTGAGKTTTIGKLATRYVLEHGAESVALVTTDTLRIAAHEQLRTFGRILNVPVKIVDKNNSLERVLYALRHKALVLIDTAGLNRQDPRLQSQLTGLNELGNRLQTVMVLPTTSQPEVIKAAYHSYKTDNLSCCILTKLDETASLGEVLSLVMEKSLPVAYSTNGQSIPDDIEVAASTPLVRAAIDLAKHVATNDELMAQELTQLSDTQQQAGRMQLMR